MLSEGRKLENTWNAVSMIYHVHEILYDWDEFRFFPLVSQIQNQTCQGLHKQHKTIFKYN
jgi:hypothetical protein